MTKICSKCKQTKELNQFNKDKTRKNGLRYWCKNCVKEYHYKNYRENLEKYEEKSRRYYQENKERSQKKHQLHKEKDNERSRKYYQKNKEKINEQHKAHWNHKYETDTNFRIRVNLRSRVRLVLKGISKSKSTIELLGCSIEQLRQHLESLFKSGMSWFNYGKWHIDHIRPCASFDLRQPSEQRKCFHYTNLQPLWAKENLRKGKQIRKC